jgi:hypothetical protein
MGEKCKPAANQKSCRNRDKHPPSGRERVPEEFRHQEQFDQPTRPDRPRQDEFGKRADIHKPAARARRGPSLIHMIGNHRAD